MALEKTYAIASAGLTVRAANGYHYPRMRKVTAIRTSQWFLVLVTAWLPGCVGDPNASPVALSGRQAVGRVGVNRYHTPTPVLPPAGRQVGLPGMRPQALALSPDGRLLAAAGKTNAWCSSTRWRAGFCKACGYRPEVPT